jgi:hypothetical protein
MFTNPHNLVLHATPRLNICETYPVLVLRPLRRRPELRNYSSRQRSPSRPYRQKLTISELEQSVQLLSIETLDALP